MTPVPTYYKMMNPTLEALHSLGGSATIDEISTAVAEIMSMSTEQLDVLQNPERGSQTKFNYRLAWARTYLKKYGLLENSARGVWALTQQGRTTKAVDSDEVKKYVASQAKATPPTDEPGDGGGDDIGDSDTEWQAELIETLIDMPPDAFERLAQRLLRESGFIQVVVTGKSGDGGIDGRGILRLGGLLSFQVVFQCKRYRGSVSSDKIRDFRGAMVGRADKGLVITTGNFTRDAVREATRDGAPAVDLVDGELLAEKLKELSLGVSTRIVETEKVVINQDWFKTI